MNQGNSLVNAGIELDYSLVDGRGLFSYLRHIILLANKKNNKEYDLFHAHYSFSGIVATIAGCKPLVVSLMGSDTKKTFFWRFIIKIFSKFFWDITIVKSSSMVKDTGIKNALIIPNGVNLDTIKPELNQKGKEKRTIVFTADPKRHSKNYKLARDAVSILNDNNIVLKVVYSKPQNEVISEIKKADLLLVTSRWEGSPNIIKEAMACNCPIVSTNVGDVEWLFGDEPGHFLTKPEPAIVAEKIQLALDFRKNHGITNGRKRITELGLDAGNIAKRIMDVYKDVLD